MRRNLLVVRAGDSSLHPQWLKAEKAGMRNWDLHVSYFGASEDPYRGSFGESLSRDSGPKYVGLAKCLQDNPAFRAYDLICFPDDDLALSHGTWSDIFDLAQRTGGSIVQPSLDERSYWSHDVTLRRISFDYRKVNFVELMCPIFKWEMLDQVAHYFNDNQSSWGLDYLWSDIARREHRTMFIMDAVCVLHTRAVGSGMLYDGMSPETELRTLLDNQAITQWSGRAADAYVNGTRLKVPMLWLNRKHIKPRIYKSLKSYMQFTNVR
jgi:hypothetical protein